MTAVYIVNTNGSKLVITKNRVAPVKHMTLPHLELMAAVVGARLIIHVQQSLNISNVTCWSDSHVILCWLCTIKPLKRFVRNRVEEIKTRIRDYPWRYCPTISNQLLWNTGPSWIRYDRVTRMKAKRKPYTDNNRYADDRWIVA